MDIGKLIARNRSDMLHSALAPFVVIVLVAFIGVKVLFGIHADTGGYYLGANGQEFNPVTAAYTGQLTLLSNSRSPIAWQTPGNVGGLVNFSPDGSRLLVLSNSYPRFLVLANADGTNAKKIIIDSKRSQTQNVAFSPDSTKLAVLSWLFSASGNPNGLELSVYSKTGNLLTSTLVNPANSNGLIEDGAEGFGWSPNGSSIAIFGANSVIFNLSSQTQTSFNPLPTPTSSLNFRFISWTSNGKSILFANEINTTANDSTDENYSLNSVSVGANGTQQAGDWNTIISYSTPMPLSSHYDLIDARYDPLDNKIYYRVPNGSSAGFYVTSLSGNGQKIVSASSCTSYYTNDIAVSADGQNIVIGCDNQSPREDIVWSSAQRAVVATINPASYPLTDNGSYEGGWRQ